jgi:hypothetical protein
MPLPNPSQQEDESAFISRCISEIYNEYGQEQSAAICYSQWEKENMSSEEDFKTLPTDDCIEKYKSKGYTDEDAKQACQKTIEVTDEGQQGGVVSNFGRVKFEFRPDAKEKMPDFMARCMSNDLVREKKKDRGVRSGFCYSQYQNKYIASLAKGWR